VAALWYSLDDLVRYGGVDLRNRVVGARALLLSIDPYNVEWRPGTPIELADTHQRYPGVTRVTAAPLSSSCTCRSRISLTKRSE
jgi:hypothetical protein